MRALDLFCGLGGWSDGLALEGFDILGVEIEPKIAQLYEHDVICSDVRNLDGEHFKGYDLIVGSPPCRDFSKFAMSVGRNWHDPPNPKRGLVLIHAFLDFVKRAQPKYWLMENVPKLREYIDLEPRCLTPLSRQRYRCFWGNFPAFLIHRDMTVKHMSAHKGELRPRNRGRYAKWENARIPLPIARSLGRAVKG